MITKPISVFNFLMIGIPKLIMVAILQIIAGVFSFVVSIFITKKFIETPAGDSIIPVALGTLTLAFLSVAIISKITKTDIVAGYPVSYDYLFKGKSTTKSVRENVRLFIKLSGLFFILYLISFVLYLLVF